MEFTIPESIAESYDRYRTEPEFYRMIVLVAKFTDMEREDIIEGRSARVIKINRTLLGLDNEKNANR